MADDPHKPCSDARDQALDTWTWILRARAAARRAIDESPPPVPVAPDEPGDEDRKCPSSA
jgi:hypothetical protein